MGCCMDTGQTVQLSENKDEDRRKQRIGPQVPNFTGTHTENTEGNSDWEQQENPFSKQLPIADSEDNEAPDM